MPLDSIADQQIQESENGGSQFQACFITSKKRMVETPFIFGTYSEVSIESLKQIKLKYIEDYEGLVKYLADFHLIQKQNKPCLLCIDNLDHYIENKSFNNLTRMMRLNFVMTLIKDCQDLLDPCAVFKINNTIVTYRCSSTDESDFLRIYNEMNKFSQQIFYVSKKDSAQSITWKLLHNCSDLKHSILNQDGQMREEQFWNHLRFIEMFKVDENPYFFEEEFNFKVGIKRDYQNMIKSEGNANNQSTAASVIKVEDEQIKQTEDKQKFNLGRPQSYKFQRVIVMNEQVVENSISYVFDPILREIIKHFEDMSRAEAIDDE
ncbi:UNKNOWN [Stylonychia lemnae]|uniref:Uncharacterized protein n=1 Tax=Stylonychia lemnae TaxID=5949 RepID=A0A078A8I2_STYLE|nr:UNKNOWN [Stylonychia lemnae]|eukprot:CDW77091.1 UNKNOWN [Stylonychia lemnae]